MHQPRDLQVGLPFLLSFPAGGSCGHKWLPVDPGYVQRRALRLHCASQHIQELSIQRPAFSAKQLSSNGISPHSIGKQISSTCNAAAASRERRELTRAPAEQRAARGIEEGRVVNAGGCERPEEAGKVLGCEGRSLAAELCRSASKSTQLL